MARAHGLPAVLSLWSLALAARAAEPDIFDRPDVYSLKRPWTWEPGEPDYLSPGGLQRFWRKLELAYRYLPADDAMVRCARTRWSSGSADCMPALVRARYEAYWPRMDPQDYDVCCQPTKAVVCDTPPRRLGLSVCGFPLGSVDHLPAFLPKLEVSLPGGPVLVYQGIGDKDLECFSGRQCRLRLFFFQHLEARLLWSTALAVYLDMVPSLTGASAIDLGAGVGLTCVVLARRGARVTCTDASGPAMEVASRNAEANNVSYDALLFNYSAPREAWPREVVPPYDLIVMGGAPMNALQEGIAAYARLFRALGRRGSRLLLEDHSYIAAGQQAWADSREAWLRHGFLLADAFDPATRGLWPMPRGRIYDLGVL